MGPFARAARLCIAEASARHEVEGVYRKFSQFLEPLVLNEPRSVSFLRQDGAWVVKLDSPDGSVRGGFFLGTSRSLEIHLEPVVSGVSVRGYANPILVNMHASKFAKPITNLAQGGMSMAETLLVQGKCP